MHKSDPNISEPPSIDAAFARFLESFGKLPRELADMTVDRTPETEAVYRTTVDESVGRVLDLVVAALPEEDRTDVRQRLQRLVDECAQLRLPVK